MFRPSVMSWWKKSTSWLHQNNQDNDRIPRIHYLILIYASQATFNKETNKLFIGNKSKKSICFGQNATATRLIMSNTNAIKWQKHIKIGMFTLANTDLLYSCCCSFLFSTRPQWHCCRVYLSMSVASISPFLWTWRLMEATADSGSGWSCFWHKV